jgi:hypothetical protein
MSFHATFGTSTKHGREEGNVTADLPSASSRSSPITSSRSSPTSRTVSFPLPPGSQQSPGVQVERNSLLVGIGSPEEALLLDARSLAYATHEGLIRYLGQGNVKAVAVDQIAEAGTTGRQCVGMYGQDEDAGAITAMIGDFPALDSLRARMLAVDAQEALEEMDAAAEAGLIARKSEAGTGAADRRTSETEQYSKSPKVETAPIQQHSKSPKVETAPIQQYSKSPKVETAPAQQYSRRPKVETAPAQQYSRRPKVETAPANQYSRRPKVETAPAHQYSRQPKVETALLLIVRAALTVRLRSRVALTARLRSRQHSRRGCGEGSTQSETATK